MRRKLFVDTNVFVEAYLDDAGASRKLVNAAGAGLVTMAVSGFLVDEVAEVFRKLYGREQSSRIRAAVLLMPRVRVVDPIDWERATAIVEPFVRDSADTPHFAAARAARVDAFVSYNRRSILPKMFSLVPLATPEIVIGALLGKTPWPSREQLLLDWQAWARRSTRSPKAVEKKRNGP